MAVSNLLSQSRLAQSKVLMLGLSVSLSFGLSPAAQAKDSAAHKMDLGDLMFFNGNTEGAIRAYRRSIEIDPNFLDGHLRLLNMYVQKNDIQAAIDECNAILQIKPNHRDTLLALGNLLRLENDLDGASRAFQRAIDSGANPAMAHHALGLTLLQKGDFDGAHQHVEEAMKHQKKFPEAHLTMGVIKFKKGDKTGCMDHFDEAIRQRPVNPEAHNAKGDILAADGKWKEAVEEYKKAVKDEPKYAQAWASIGNAEFQLGDMEAARDAYNKARALSPKDKNIVYGLALALEKSGKISEALTEFGNGLSLEDDPNMRAQISMHMQQLGGGAGAGFNIGGIGTGQSLMQGAAGQNPFGVSFGDMIKLKPPPGVEDNSQKKK